MLTSSCLLPTKALEEVQKDALHELEHYECGPVTFNAGELTTDLVRFWEVSLTFPSPKEGTDHLRS